ncbi:GNAT family N-acetyltransferase [Cellulomonas shaoxiangyii]|uniref:GNAT family N-acetyltransferase n=1 Tax=Cellulomonas shaoxiangyii TaxID=2566013 RepID=A0A4P7SJ08_9CELL|nr:GNAT family N-acetyltransferase [Cellulomonas shaoxiangyii]QCB93658.1 GNAT family N-acetyltransferase [Cellulomonas shaoxiangyii]TGY86139.1 GNAT family N-acetyltransferase [Cellulomonas shaoxiangyii]
MIAATDGLVDRLPGAFRSRRWLLADRDRWCDARVLGDDRDVLLVRSTDAGLVAMCAGDGAGVPRLLAELARGIDAPDGESLAWLTAPRSVDVDPGTLAALGVAPFSTWDRMSTDTPPPPVAGEDAVVPLDASATDEVVACLAEANPGTRSLPGAPDDAGWWGVRDGGRLVGVIGATRRLGSLDGRGSWHLHALGVVPSARGRGLGAALAATALRAGLGSGLAWVSLGMYADNDVARRLYLRLGLSVDEENASYARPGFDGGFRR